MDARTIALLAEYPVVISLPVQWGDQDAFGHVNNTVYFRWFESARIAYLSQIGLQDKGSADNLGPILAAISCNYRRQLQFPDTVHVGSRVTRIGRSSIIMQHAIVSESQQAVAADGEATVVAFDYTRNQSQPVPDSLRQAIAALEASRQAR